MYKNDVWRSTFSFNDLTALSKACGVAIPACGPGLSCLPGLNTRVDSAGRVTCSKIVDCGTTNLAFTPLVATANFPPRHSPGVELLKVHPPKHPLNHYHALTLPSLLSILPVPARVAEIGQHQRPQLPGQLDAAVRRHRTG